MADYKEQTISGQQWQRVWRVECDNKLGGQRRITYYEETAVKVGDHVITSPISKTLVKPFDATTEGDTFDLVHPMTGETVGTMTEQALFIALFSHYLHTASQRDAQNAA